MRRSQLLARLCLGGWAALILAGSLLREPPGAEAVMGFSGADLLAHLVAYAVLALLAVWAHVGLGWRDRLLAAGISAALFGLMIECLQPLTGRVFELADLAANVLGAGLGIALAALLRASTGRSSP
ncbi:MAG: VanZ family protein [Planctomycetota bacterium]|jgi:VanZ family protein